MCAFDCMWLVYSYLLTWKLRWYLIGNLSTWPLPSGSVTTCLSWRTPSSSASYCPWNIVMSPMCSNSAVNLNVYLIWYSDKLFDSVQLYIRDFIKGLVTCLSLISSGSWVASTCWAEQTQDVSNNTTNERLLSRWWRNIMVEHNKFTD